VDAGEQEHRQRADGLSSLTVVTGLAVQAVQVQMTSETSTTLESAGKQRLKICLQI